MKFLITFLIIILSVVNGDQQLFAVIGGTQCAESLYYGPQTISLSGSTDGQNSFYLSTSTTSKNIPHKDWVQVVTSDGTTELFRIYWAFSTARTLAEHFSIAVSSGERVSYRIIDTANGGTEYYKSGIWWFSTGSRITTSSFNVATTTCCFSYDDGAWGAGSGTIQSDGASNNYNTTSFWGIGNWKSLDSSDCGNIYREGALLSYYPHSRTYMYYEDNTTPSTLHTDISPLTQNLWTSTDIPTSEPTISPTQTLFAVVGFDCAASLPYGPQSITQAGSADTQYPYYVSTNTENKAVRHRKWLQIVTSDGTTELFRIYWTFSTAKTLALRFIDAVKSGEAVSYEVHDAASGQVYTYSGTWWFSKKAGKMKPRFSAITTECCFSEEDGVWGAASGIIKTVVDYTNYYETSFWGIASFEHGGGECHNIYKNGVLAETNTHAKTYMYYGDPMDPTTSPTAAPSLPITPVPTSMPSASSAPTLLPTARPTNNLTTEFLFAVIGSGGCARSLYYGPQNITTAGSADGKHRYFLSTATGGKAAPHSEWMQIVTSDGITEMFRIYWTFSTAKTLADRFQAAVSYGEAVSYEVYDAASGQVYTYSGTWWFSKVAGEMRPRFAATTPECCFSSSRGLWGAGSGNIYAGGEFPGLNFWGIGMSDLYNKKCSRIDKQGVAVFFSVNAVSYIYYYANTALTVEPTHSPTSAPSTPNPTIMPSTQTPTISPSTSSPTQPSAAPTTFPTQTGLNLFAVLCDNSCAKNLRYGPQSLTTAGTVNPYFPCFLSTSTVGKDIPHKEWLQIVTSDGTTELFRIYWNFYTARTLAQHFNDAVKYGVSVRYTVMDVQTDTQYSYIGRWYFSRSAGTMDSRFTTPTTQHGFSNTGGTWGAGSGTIDGNDRVAPSSYWGIGNFDTQDTSCTKIYKQGVASSNYGSSLKVYMYYSTLAEPTVYPTPAPSSPPEKIILKVIQNIVWDGYASYRYNQALFDSVHQQTILDSVAGITLSNIQDYRVTSESSHRALSQASSLRSLVDTAEPIPMYISSYVWVEYRLVLTGTGRSYDDMRTQLEGAVQSASFDASLQSNAFAQGAFFLAGATSSAFSIEDETSYATDTDDNNSSSNSNNSSNDSNVITLPVIIGIAGGGAALIIIAILWMCRRNIQTMKPPPLRRSAIGESSPVQLTGVQYWEEQEQPQPQQLTITPSAPPISCSETDIMLGSSSSAPVMCMNRSDVYLHRPIGIVSDTPVLAVAVSSSDPYKRGEVVAYAQVYTGEQVEEEAKV